MSPPYAVILAGGQGSRLGEVRKGDLRIGGRRLLERVVETLDGVRNPVLVSTGPLKWATTLPAGCVSVADLSGEHTGPLAGIVAALTMLARQGVDSGVLISVAVDSPLLPDDFVARLMTGVDDAPAAFAGWGTAFYPTNAAWRIEALADIASALGKTGALRSPKALQRQLGARLVDWSGVVPHDPFANVNTLADLIGLQKRFR